MMREPSTMREAVIEAVSGMLTVARQNDAAHERECLPLWDVMGYPVRGASVDEAIAEWRRIVNHGTRWIPEGTLPARPPELLSTPWEVISHGEEEVVLGRYRAEHDAANEAAMWDRYYQVPVTHRRVNP